MTGVDMLNGLVIYGAALLVAVLVLRAAALWALYRYAPVWLVGPNGFLIDTRTRLGLLQMRATPSRDASGGGGGCSDC